MQQHLFFKGYEIENQNIDGGNWKKRYDEVEEGLHGGNDVSEEGNRKRKDGVSRRVAAGSMWWQPGSALELANLAATAQNITQLELDPVQTISDTIRCPYLKGKVR